MNNSIAQFLINLALQLPLLLVYLAGFILAFNQRPTQPRIANLTMSALGILFCETVIMTGVISWLPQLWADRGVSADEIRLGFALISLVRNLINAAAFALLLAALFRGGVKRKPPSLLFSLLGGLLGLIAGGGLAILFGEPLGIAFGIGAFEGERGYFVGFCLLPLFAVVGGITGFLLVRLLRTKHQAVSFD